VSGPNPIADDEFSFKDVAESLNAATRRGSASALPPRIEPVPVASMPAPTSAPPPLDPIPPPTAETASDFGPEIPIDSVSGAPEPAPIVLGSAAISPRHQLEAWLALMVKERASDLILRAGGRPSHRVDGKIGFFPGSVPAAGPLLEVLEGIMGKEKMNQWRESGSADAALHLDGLGRFRLNAYRQMGEPAVVLRRINEQAPVIDTLELPAENLKKLAMRKRGLILVTGIAGSGKSTTLGAMIQHMNETVERHIVTLEDPVELLFTESRCVISQREVGTDCTTFQNGLRHALRQSPDVILIGEMRDAETVNAALDATETGHLVMSTLHTVNAPQTVERILSFFPSEQHPQVRQRMADNLAGVLSQRLIPRTGGKGQIPAFELMVSTPHVRELLLEGKTGELGRVIDQGTERGLISFNMCLRRLVQERKVELNDALAASDRPEELVLALRGITGSAARPETTNPPRPPAGGDGLRLAKRD
jgi:twitching motility protein PilT